MTTELHSTDFLSILIQQYQGIAYCDPLAQHRKRDEPRGLGRDTEVSLTGYQDTSALQKHQRMRPIGNSEVVCHFGVGNHRWYHNHAKYYVIR